MSIFKMNGIIQYRHLHFYTLRKSGAFGRCFDVQGLGLDCNAVCQYRRWGSDKRLNGNSVSCKIYPQPRSVIFVNITTIIIQLEMRYLNLAKMMSTGLGEIHSTDKHIRSQGPTSWRRSEAVGLA